MGDGRIGQSGLQFNILFYNADGHRLLCTHNLDASFWVRLPPLL